MILISTYLYPYTQVDLEGKISPIYNVPLDILAVVSSGGAPTPAGTSVFTKHNWDIGMGYLWLNGWGIYHLMGGAFMT